MTTVPAPARRREAPAAGWTLVLPVKGGPEAKSRLVPPPGVVREDLALAIALDAVEAVTACPLVATALVVTHDRRVARGCAALGTGPRAAAVRVLHERAPGRGLGAAIADGTAAAPAGPLAVLLPDLPALRPDDVAAALRSAHRLLTAPRAPVMAFLPDAEGIGTVLLAARSAGALRPAFGPASAAAHSALGAARLEVADDVAARLCRDVDTAAALRQAVTAGVGRHTGAVLLAGSPRA